MGRILDFDYYDKDLLCTRCHVDYNSQKIDIINFVDDPLLQAFGRRKMSIDEIDEFFREHCFPETRYDKDTLLEMLGLKHFDAEAICRKTHGMCFGDTFWIKFGDNDNTTYEDIKRLRNWD